MGKKLYVGNLPFSMTDEGLQQMFAQAGNVESAKIIQDRASGRSKGFGFVEMASDEEAAAAISKLNGTDCEGQKPVPWFLAKVVAVVVDTVGVGIAVVTAAVAVVAVADAVVSIAVIGAKLNLC